MGNVQGVQELKGPRKTERKGEKEEKEKKRKEKKRKENGGAGTPESPLSTGPERPRYATDTSSLLYTYLQW